MNERLINIQTYSPAIQQYIKIKHQHQDCILFFRLGDFYELLFEDAELVSKELEIALTTKNCGDGKKAAMAGVPYHSYEPYLYKLIEKGYKVAIVEQLQDPKEVKGIVERGVVRIISKGTINEGNNLEAKENNFLCAISKYGDKFDITFVDISTGEIIVGSDFDLEEVVNEVLSQKPSELVLDNTLSENNAFRLLSVTLNTQNTVYNNVNINEFIQTAFSSYTNVKSLHFIFNYIADTQKRTMTHFTSINEIDHSYMKLDHFTIKNLELIENLHEKKKKGSLLWILDKTKTAAGGRLLKQWIQKPLVNLQKINHRLNAVSSFYNDVFLREDIHVLLEKVYDLERIISKLSFGTLNAKDVVALSRSLEIIPSFKEAIVKSDNPYIKNLVSNISDLQNLYSILEQAIVDDPPLTLKDGGIIREGYNQEIDYYKNLQDTSKEWLVNFEEQEKKKTGISTLKVGYTRGFGYYIEISKKQSQSNQIPTDYNRLQTLLNAERYTTEELVNKANEILNADEKVKELEYKVFIDVRNEIEKHIIEIKNLSLVFATIDVLISFAIVASENKYCMPNIIDNEQKFLLKDNRHPVAEEIMQNYIPNDINLDKNHNIMLITGPNASGKSTYMKAVALSVLMAQIGSFVPSSMAEFSIVDRVFTRIGSADDILNGDSTFMLEMKEINQALTHSTEKSLIIIDELGRGTSTTEGKSIAKSVIEYIHEHKNARSLIATHYHELTILEEHLLKLKNYSMQVYEDGEQVIFLHKMSEGKAGKSYGIYCARLCNLPEEVITSATRYLETTESVDDVFVPEEPKKVELIEKLSQPSSQEQVVKEDNQEEILKMLNQILNNQKIKEEFAQLDLFTNTSQHEQLMSDIKKIDILNVTPIQAFQILYDIVQKAQ